MASVLFDKCHVAVASVIQCYLWNHCSKVGVIRICLSSSSEAWWTPSAASVIQCYFCIPKWLRHLRGNGRGREDKIKQNEQNAQNVLPERDRKRKGIVYGKETFNKRPTITCLKQISVVTLSFVRMIWNTLQQSITRGMGGGGWKTVHALNRITSSSIITLLWQ